MGTTTYTTVNGRVVSQNKAGVYSQLMRDPLGNVIATANSAGTKANDTTYWPYGEVRTGGVSATTPFGFCGTWGYYTDSTGRQYVRARYYRPVLGRWQTVDPLWIAFVGNREAMRVLGITAFSYCMDLPNSLTDRLGTFPGDYIYGEWCGRLLPAAGTAPAPVDAVDNCCMIHDFCLGCGLQAVLMYGICACNMVDCLFIARFRCGLNPECWIKATIMLNYFKLYCPSKWNIVF